MMTMKLRREPREQAAINPRLPMDSPMMTRNATSREDPFLSKESHGALEPESSVPAQQFLGSMREDHTPNTTRRIKPAQESSVLNKLYMSNLLHLMGLNYRVRP